MSVELAVQRIVSGGQTGVDEGALDAAIALGLPHGGWCPRGRINERGMIPARFSLRETDSAQYPQRTELNVVDSDATLILFRDRLQGGTALTERMAAKHRRPCLTVDLHQSPIDLDAIRGWLDKHEVAVVNVAGPRESSQPGIYEKTRTLIEALWDSTKSTLSFGDS